jgi:hypothetical protein
MPSQDAERSVPPGKEYAHRLTVHREEMARQARILRSFVRGKGLAVGLIILLAVLAEKEPAATVLAVLLLPTILTVVIIAQRRRAGRALRKAALAATFNEHRIACLEGRWAGHGEPGTRYLVQDHPAVQDLDLFGSGSLFEMLCTAHSRQGQDTLASWLSAPASVNEIQSRQAAVRELQSRGQLREDFAVQGSELPARGHFAALTRWATKTTAAPMSWPIRWVVGLVPALTLSAVIAWVIFGVRFELLLVAVAVQAGIAWGLRRSVQSLLGPAEEGKPTLLPLAYMLAPLERESFTCSRLTFLVSIIRNGRLSASALLKTMDRVLGWAIPAAVLGCRPQLAMVLADWHRKWGQEVGRWLAAIGELEALCALATYAHENPDAIFPEVVPEGPCFQAEGLGHPLLPRDRYVPNEISLGKEARLLVVSGSNMSGKSTLLRTVGINAVLALTGAPVRAARLRLSPLVVGATLRVQDSLQAGRSRFYAEALRVRQLLDLADGPVALLFLLDELFQGTNSQDRRVGAEAVLRRLLDRGAIGLVTTHDLALTSLTELLPRSANVHFEDRFIDGVMSFDYRLRPGVVPTSNGLALLRAVGIEV